MKRNIFKKYTGAIAGIYCAQRGMTGLETAIILIAFVTVAAVFGYAVLSAGLFSAERGKETVYAGLAQAKANMELSGGVIIKVDNDTASEIRFTVRNAIAGTPIDMTPNGLNENTGVNSAGENRCVLSLTTSHAYYNNIFWDIVSIGEDDNDNLLESGEQMEITVYLEPKTLLAPQETTGTWEALTANDWFNIQVKPILGSTMTVQRTLPAGLDDIMDMH